MDIAAGTEDQVDQVTSRVTVDAPPDEVWELLVDDDELSAWLGDEVTLEPVPGGRGRVTDDGGVEREIRIDEVDPGRSITWRWWPSTEPDGPEAGSDVQIVLVPDGERTEIRVTETVCSIATADRRRAHAPSIAASPAMAVRAAWSDRLLSAEIIMLSRQPVLVRV